MAHTSVIWRCTVQMHSGKFCDEGSMPDAPFPICPHHAYRLWKRMSEMVSATERDHLHILTLAMQQMDEKRAREDKRQAARDHVVYYLLIGDMLKIGTSGNLKQRLLSYPPHKKLLAVEPGTYTLERQRHREFAALLASGKEWFRFEGPLVEHVQRLRADAA